MEQRKKKVMLWYLLAAVLVGIDQLVKSWVRGNIPLGESVPFLPHLMELTYVQNTGAAFSSFSDMTWVLTLISLGASVAIGMLLWQEFFPGKWGQLSLTLLLGGAVGNLIDRAVLGFVTDMFATTFIDFAVFNVADICVVVGILMAVYAIFLWEKEKENGNDPA